MVDGPHGDVPVIAASSTILDVERDLNLEPLTRDVEFALELPVSPRHRPRAERGEARGDEKHDRHGHQ
jgi:hypothetical protein